MDHQNWDYTVYNCGGPGKGQKQEQTVNKALQAGEKVQTQKKTDNYNKHNQLQGAYIAQVCSEEQYKVLVDTVSHDLKIAIQQARTQKGWTQEQFAKQIMEKKTVVSDYESGRAIPNSGIIQKMERQLGVKLPRAPKNKQKKTGVVGYDDQF